MVILIVVDLLGMIPNDKERSGGIRNQWKNQYHPNYSTA